MMVQRALPQFPIRLGDRSAWHRQPGKRLLDLILASTGILLLSPLLITTWALIWWTTPGGALFRQTRIGQFNRPFTIYKFRTMYVDCHDDIHRKHVHKLFLTDGQHSSGMLDKDPRITRVGQVLRRTSIDELPQLFNVLKGEMSLVGPRPMLSWEVELLDAPHRRRFLVLPGITGLWQVNGRKHLTPGQSLELDLAYVERQNFFFDLKILARTLPAVLTARGAS
jgi:lipopolysaccharide/colanic/teichoic acid biosynthesis glycosyltransferase